MAHYAKLDENNVVTGVIVIADKDCLDENNNVCEENGRRLCEALTRHANWKKTSYNTRDGIHYDPNTGEPSTDQSKSLRINFAFLEPNMKYDENLDAFIPPKILDMDGNICESWTLENYKWTSPISRPNVEDGYTSLWSETQQKWIVETLEYCADYMAKSLYNQRHNRNGL